jgi:hypothetical protein
MGQTLITIINFFKIYVVLGAAIYIVYGLQDFGHYLFGVAGLWAVLGFVDWIKR